jgi:hypothetical protein
MLKNNQHTALSVHMKNKYWQYANGRRFETKGGRNDWRETCYGLYPLLFLLVMAAA